MTKQRPLAEEGLNCPLYKEDMSKVCHKCAWWIQIRGVHPQTGEPVSDEWGCSMAWLPVLVIETAQQSRQAGAAVESMRNEIVSRMDDVKRLT